MAGRLLVVNDEPETGRALQGPLALEGFDVVLVTDEAEALEVVEDTEPDAVIADLAEPDYLSVTEVGSTVQVCAEHRPETDPRCGQGEGDP